MKGLWVIGFRAAGKTTFGRALAEKLALPFLDLDQEFVRRQGAGILDYVAKRGLSAFRAEEEILLREAAAGFVRGEARVVSTGGGFVDWAPSRACLEASAAPKLFLDPPAELLWDRLHGDPDRQKIGDLSSRAAMDSLLEKRRPFYEKIASISWKNQDINGCLTALKAVL